MTEALLDEDVRARRSIRRRSSSTSTGSSRRSAAMAERDARPRASRSGRTPRPTRASRSARRQIAAGAVGLTVATIGEAEVFADGGLDDLFIAYPVVARRPEGRAAACARRDAPAAVGIDSVDGARRARRCTRRRTGPRVGARRDRLRRPPDAASRRPTRGLSRRGGATAGSRWSASSPTAATAIAGREARAAAADDEVRGLTDAAASLRADRHRAERRQRRVHADGVRLGARRRDRGAAGDVRVRRPPTGRSRVDRAATPRRPSSPHGSSA